MLQRLVTGTDTTVHEALVVFVDASGFMSPGSLTKVNRAYVALATLRKKGLRDLLVSADGGYLLAQSVVVRRE